MADYRPVSGTPLLSPSRETAFPASVHETPPRFLRRNNVIPSSLKAWTTVPTIVVMLILALVIEIALYLSHKRHGFPVGQLSTEQVQWLSGFLPVLVIGPLVWICYCMDRDFKILQPYVALSQGPIRADDSLLLRAEETSIFTVVYSAFKYGNGVIVTASIIVFISAFWYPLAASLFFVKDGISSVPLKTPVRSLATIGLNPSYTDLTPFVAAAGYAEAAALYNLSDPPFVSGGWSVAEFTIPSDMQNSTLSVHTTALLTNVSCTIVSGVTMNPSPTFETFNLSATLPGQGTGCSMAQPINASGAQYQYGVNRLNGCTLAQSSGLSGREEPFTVSPFASTIFWFAALPVRRNPLGGQPPNGALLTRQPLNAKGSAVVCSPKLTSHSVEVVVDDTRGSVLGVKPTGNTSLNNVTELFDGLFFNSTQNFDLQNPSDQQRELGVQVGISGSIFRMAADPSRGTDMSGVFDRGFLEQTEKIYTQYLSTSARSVYFVPENTSLDAEITASSLRLWINSISGHILSLSLLFATLCSTAIHLIHRRQRRRLYLASKPGSMAHYISLLSGEASRGLIGPMDDEKTMEQKLHGRWFILDMSGSVVPVDSANNWAAGDQESGAHPRRHSNVPSDLGYELEDPRKALLTPEYKLER